MGSITKVINKVAGSDNELKEILERNRTVLQTCPKLRYQNKKQILRAVINSYCGFNPSSLVEKLYPELIRLGENEIYLELRKQAYKFQSYNLISSKTDLSEKEHVQILKELDTRFNDFMKIQAKAYKVLADSKQEKHPLGLYEIQ